MQLSACGSLRRAASGGTERHLSDSKHFLTGNISVGHLNSGPRNSHRRQRSHQLCVRSFQRGSSASQERASAPSPPPRRASAPDSTPAKSGTPKRSPTAAQPRNGLSFKSAKRGGDAALVNNIAPVTIRARAAWRMLGRGRRSPSLDRQSIGAAARSTSRSAPAKPASPVTGRPGTRGAADAAAVAAAGAALAPFPRLLRRAEGLHKPVGLVLASAHVLFTACALTGDHRP